MKEEMPIRRDIAHTILSVIFICVLIALTFWTLRPFLVSIAWGSTIAIAMWPALERLQARLSNKRGLAVSLIAAALLLIVLAPLTLAVMTIAENAKDITAQIKSFEQSSLVPPPKWLDRIPIAGERIAKRWASFAELSPEERSAVVTAYTQRGLQWFAARAGSTGRTILNVILTMLILTIILAKGETFREGLLSFARRLGGRQGEDVARLAAKAMRGVMLGIVVTAAIQAAVGGIGLFIAGVPASGLLTAVMFILCLSQLGPQFVLIPSVVWLYWSGDAVWGTVLLIISVCSSISDNFLRPWLIKKGADLPLLLVIIGVFGGLLAFGIIGLFIGPVILAIAYTLLKVWVSDGVQSDTAESIAK